MFYVYEHWRTDKNVPFYVGKGNDKRIKSTVRNNKWHKKISNYLISNGYPIEQKIVLEYEIEQDALDAEMLLIDIYKDAGINLVNKTKGGLGFSGGKHSKEAKAKMSKKQFNRQNGPNGTEIRNAQREILLNHYNGENGDKNRLVIGSKVQAHYASDAGNATRQAQSDWTNDRWYGDNGAKNREAQSLAIRGTKHHNCKITEHTAQLILDFPGSKKEAAEHFSVSYNTVYFIKKRMSWRHLTPSDKIINGDQEYGC